LLLKTKRASKKKKKGWGKHIQEKRMVKTRLLRCHVGKPEEKKQRGGGGLVNSTKWASKGRKTPTNGRTEKKIVGRSMHESGNLAWNGGGQKGTERENGGLPRENMAPGYQEDHAKIQGGRKESIRQRQEEQTRLG